MASIIIGNSDYAWNSGNGFGWNAAGEIWGNSASNTFLFEDNTWTNEVTSNDSWKIYGNGGSDTVDFTASTTGVAFAISKLQSGSTYTLTGSNFSDSFLWNGRQTFPTIYGGNDSDTLSASTSTSAVTINLYDSKIHSVEYLEGSSLGDVLRGSSLGDETLDGGKGADNLWGGKGDDVMLGGTGADTYWFAALDGSDVIANDSANNAGDSVLFYGLKYSELTFERVNNDADLKVSVKVSDGYTDNLILTDWGVNTDSNRVNRFITTDITFGLAIGTASAETLTGTSLPDYIFAGAGNDTIDGGAGSDAIYAGDGEDLITYKTTAWQIDGGDGTDTLTATATSKGVTIDLRNVDNTQTFTNIEAVVGSSYADILRGSSVSEILIGGAGADNLWGAAENDEMTGGYGVDSYWFGIGDGNDTITADTSNNTDYVIFYGGMSGNDIQRTIVGGDDLTITFTSIVSSLFSLNLGVNTFIRLSQVATPLETNAFCNAI